MQHFPGYAPAVAWPGRQRALCFDGFAVLHSGENRCQSVNRFSACILRGRLNDQCQ